MNAVSKLVVAVEDKGGRKLTSEESADLLEVSEVRGFIDLGHSFLYKLFHPGLGMIVLVNSCMGASGYFPV